MLISLLLPNYVVIIARLTYIAIFVYILISLRNLYQQSWFKTVMKSIIATLLTVLAMAMVAVIYMGITLITEQQKGDNVNYKFESNVEHPETEKEPKK